MKFLRHIFFFRHFHPAHCFCFSREFLVRHFKYAVLIIFIAAAVITPSGDAATQALFALPMIGLYVIGIVIAWVVAPVAERDEGLA